MSISPTRFSIQPKFAGVFVKADNKWIDVSGDADSSAEQVANAYNEAEEKGAYSISAKKAIMGGPPIKIRVWHVDQPLVLTGEDETRFTNSSEGDKRRLVNSWLDGYLDFDSDFKAEKTSLDLIL